MMDPAGSGRAIINIAVAEIDLLPRGKGRRHKITARTFLSDKHQQRTFFSRPIIVESIPDAVSNSRTPCRKTRWQFRFACTVSKNHVKKTNSIRAIQTNRFSEKS